MCSILCWIFSIWEALGCIFCIFGLIHALPTRGVSLSMIWLAACIEKVSKWFRASFELGQFPRWYRPVRWGTPGWPVWVPSVGRSSTPVWLVWLTGLTGQSKAEAIALFWQCGLHAFVQGELHWFWGSLHVCKGSSLSFSGFGLVVCALCLSIVLSRMCRAIALS
jgi:hypothetical protein